jgi:transposase
MSRKRRKFSPEFKARVALEALSGDHALSELSSKYGVHPNQISTWKKRAKEGIVDSFSGRKKRDSQGRESQIRDRHAKIGELTVEKDYLVSAFAEM